MNEAESKLKEKEHLVMSASKQSSSSSRISGISGLIGSQDIFVRDDEESVDSDLSMRGKVFHRWVGEEKEEEKEEEEEEEDYEEDEDDKYYENKSFEKKDCDIIVESSEDSIEAAQQEEDEVIIDSSDDEENTNIQKMNFSWAATTTKTIGDEDIARLIEAEEETIETASTSVNFNEDEELSVEEIDQNVSLEINIETPSETPPIEILDSPVEDKPGAQILFSEDLAKEEDDVIEIESDEEKPEKEEADVPTGKILFSSMFSSRDEEYSEDDQPDKPAEGESDLPGNWHQFWYPN